jgi:hypothetical protein
MAVKIWTAIADETQTSNDNIKGERDEHLLSTVAWSGTLSPDLQTDVSMRTFLGKGSGESFQMKFEGDGWVVLQPYEEVYMQQSSS